MSSSSEGLLQKTHDFACHDTELLHASILPSVLAATVGADKEISIWKLSDATPVRLFTTKSTTPVECVQLGGDGSRMVYGTMAGALRLVDLATQTASVTLRGHCGNVTCVTENASSGNLWASGSLDSTIRLWDIRANSAVTTLKSHEKRVNTIEFSPHGEWILSGSDDCQLKLTDVRTGKVFASMSGHTAAVVDAKFHPTYYLLASASADKTARFWDADSFECVSQSESTTSSSPKIAFHQHEVRVLLVQSGGDVRFCGYEPYRLFHRAQLISDGPLRPLDVAAKDDKLTMLLAYAAQRRLILYQVVYDKLNPLLRRSDEEFWGGAKETTPTVETPNLLRSKLRRSFHENCPPLSAAAAVSRCASSASTSGGSLSSANSSPSHRVDAALDEADAFRAKPKIPRSRDVSPSSDNAAASSTTADHIWNPLDGETPDAIQQTFTIHTPEQKAASGGGVAVKQQQRVASPSLGRRPSHRAAKPSAPTANNNSAANKPSTTTTTAAQFKEPKGPARKAAVAKVTPQQAAKKVEKVSPLPRVPPRAAQPLPTTTLNQHGSTAAAAASSASVNVQEFLRPVQLPSSSTALSAPLEGLSLSGGGASQSTELSALMREGLQLRQVLGHRARSLAAFRQLWARQGLRVAAAHLLQQNDSALTVDLLAVLNQKPTLWSLDLCSTLLPELRVLLMEARYVEWTTAATAALRTVTRSFGDAIRHGRVRPPGNIGVDVHREERQEKCERCYRELLMIKAESAEKQKLSSANGPLWREIAVLTHPFDSSSS